MQHERIMGSVKITETKGKFLDLIRYLLDWNLLSSRLVSPFDNIYFSALKSDLFCNLCLNLISYCCHFLDTELLFLFKHDIQIQYSIPWKCSCRKREVQSLQEHSLACPAQELLQSTQVSFVTAFACNIYMQKPYYTICFANPGGKIVIHYIGL